MGKAREVGAGVPVGGRGRPKRLPARRDAGEPPVVGTACRLAPGPLQDVPAVLGGTRGRTPSGVAGWDAPWAVGG